MPLTDPALPAQSLLLDHFGYSEFRPLQARVMSALEEGRDVLAVLPTGAGKSICFQIPALLRGAPTVVVSPLISLMQDQVAAARARGIAAEALNSSLDAGSQRAALDRITGGEVRLVYTSPERLGRLAEDLAAQRCRPALFAVDEAHCISEWGPDFRPSYRSLRRLRARLGWPQAIALTGSATPSVRREVVRAIGLGGPEGPSIVLGSFDRRNLWFGVARVGNERERLVALVDALRWEQGLAMVYAPTRSLVEELARVLRDAGFRTAAYHAGLGTQVRREALERFMTDHLKVIVATSAFGMGIDKPDVRLVVHWTMPSTPEAYYQESGRSGRDGGLARCLLLYRPGDAILPRRQLDVTFPSEALAERVWRGELDAARVPANLRASLRRLHRELRPGNGTIDWRPVRRRRIAALARIEVMDRYAKCAQCRRRALIGYFGEELRRCSGCDVCSRSAPRPVRDRAADRRLGRLRLALAHADSPWNGCVIEPEVLRRLATNPPASAQALAKVEGVGVFVVQRYGRTMLEALSGDG
jgi:ATP-dependent DNA helicase RecQ